MLSLDSDTAMTLLNKWTGFALRWGLARLSVIFLAFLCLSRPVWAAPWAEAGDAQLRSDLDVLAASGLIDDITTQWPIPWAGVLDRLNTRSALDDQPLYIRDAAKRVLAKASDGLDTDGVRFSASFDLTNLPDVIHGFDGLGRQDAQMQFSGEAVGNSTAGRLSIGARSSETKDRQILVLDDSYIAQRVGNAIVYGGYVSHWWGPGWVSALSLSNNARPFPQIGIERMDTSAFQTPWLSWLGPWQLEGFVGVLDGPRQARHTIYDGLRATINPLPGLELAVARTDEMCGSGHPCDPFRAYFDLQNNNVDVNQSNDESQLDLRYSRTIFHLPFEFYVSLMNEDNNPIIHSVTSHQVGASAWFALKPGLLRLTAEYTDTVPTVNIFSFGDYFYGDAYNNGTYRDGMRYRGRTLGFSLDSDSRLATLQASLVNALGMTYSLSLNHAQISDRENLLSNVVTTAPVLVNLAEAKVTIPFSSASVGLAARLQDNQPRPKTGFAAAGELSLKLKL